MSPSLHRVVLTFCSPLWGIRETDMSMNNCLNHEVAVAGDVTHATASEQAAGGAHHFLRAHDVVVEGNSCGK